MMTDHEHSASVLVTDQEMSFESLHAASVWRQTNGNGIWRSNAGSTSCWSCSASCCCWPLLLLIAIAIKLHSEGPVIFTQERVGYDQRTRTVRTFRFLQVSLDAGEL